MGKDDKRIRTMKEMMREQSDLMLARWILKNLDWSGGNSDENGEFVAAILEEHRRQVAARPTSAVGRNEIIEECALVCEQRSGSPAMAAHRILLSAADAIRDLKNAAPQETGTGGIAPHAPGPQAVTDAESGVPAVAAPVSPVYDTVQLDRDFWRKKGIEACMDRMQVMGDSLHSSSIRAHENTDAMRYRRIRLKAWLDSCVDDLVVNTPQAKESEFNAGHDSMIDAEYPDVT